MSDCHGNVHVRRGLIGAWQHMVIMEAAKDLLKRAVELDSAQKFSEALICYEEGIQNLLRAMGGAEIE